MSLRCEHGSIQAGMALEELRVLHLHLKAATRILASTQLRWESQSPPPHSDTPTPTRLHLLIVPLPGPSILKAPQRVNHDGGRQTGMVGNCSYIHLFIPCGWDLQKLDDAGMEFSGTHSVRFHVPSIYGVVTPCQALC